MLLPLPIRHGERAPSDIPPPPPPLGWKYCSDIQSVTRIASIHRCGRGGGVGGREEQCNNRGSPISGDICPVKAQKKGLQTCQVFLLERERILLQR